MAYVRVRIPFVKKLSGIAIVKLRYKYHIVTMRVKLDNNQSILRIINNTDEMIHYTPQLCYVLHGSSCVSVDALLYAQLILYMNNTELMLLRI